MTVQRINLPELGLPAGPYSHAVIQGQTLYTSGFTAYGTTAQAKPVKEQAQAIFRQFEIIAASQNTTLANLIKVTVFLTDPSDIPELREALVALYGPNVPASSMVIVGSLFAPDLAVEIEAILAL
ncbi:RidA family protein [Denitrobaculum tricleocarpae]|uniref:RidA family protein n=1 Tax=Denitrobaculum tricleocarpae TaxID=2591009 RepID=A0A545TB76_9PROT|nr:RidA family protein [Denitrobaculum tricleocarpae]TQV74451.1 RidA family protein [Denitrobaculum tricleocarpae]